MNAILNYINGGEFLIGFPSNILVVFICLRPKLRKIPSFIFLAFISIGCLIELCSIALMSFVDELFKLNLQNKSLAWCRSKSFFNSFSYQWFAWIVAFYCLELSLCTRYHLVRRTYSTVKTATTLCISSGLILTILNLPNWFIQLSYPIANSNTSNQTLNLICMVTKTNTNSLLLSYLAVVRTFYFYYNN